MVTHEVFVVAGVLVADLGLSRLEHEPEPVPGGAIGERELDSHSVVGQLVAIDEVRHVPEDDEGVEVFRVEFQPTGTPGPECFQDGTHPCGRLLSE